MQTHNQDAHCMRAACWLSAGWCIRVIIQVLHSELTARLGAIAKMRPATHSAVASVAVAWRNAHGTCAQRPRRVVACWLPVLLRGRRRVACGEQVMRAEQLRAKGIAGGLLVLQQLHTQHASGS